jgi:3-hydroxyacyl-[acyl-carrier-protein] dehydratase
MARPIFDYKELNLDKNKPLLDVADVEAINPHRHEFRLLDKILHANEKEQLMVGLFEVREDQFWCRGHIPGRPIFPGVLQLEAAAQMSSILGRYFKLISPDKFFGLVGFEKVKYRRQVLPGDDLLILGRVKEHTERISSFSFQSIVNDKIVNQGEVLGTLF